MEPHFVIVDTYQDGEAYVVAYECGCEDLDAKTYRAWFPCSKAHSDVAHSEAEGMGRVAA